MFDFPSTPNFVSKLERSRRLFGRKQKKEEDEAGPPPKPQADEDALRFKEMLRKEPAIPPPSLLLEDLGDCIPASARPPPTNIPEIVLAAPPTERG